MKGKEIGIGLIVVGAGLVIWGFQIAGTWSAKATKFLGGATPTEAMLLWIGGAALIGIGVFRLFNK
jgi:hypothetical protein